MSHAGVWKVVRLGRDGVSFPSSSSWALARGLGGAVVEGTTPEWEGHGPVLWATARAALAGRDTAQAFGAAAGCAARTSSLAAGRWHSATGAEACEEQDGNTAGRLGAHRSRPPRHLGVRS